MSLLADGHILEGMFKTFGISKKPKFNIGNAITDINELRRLCNEKKSVYIRYLNRCLPASVLVNWSYIMLYRSIDRADLFYYDKIEE